MFGSTEDDDVDCLFYVYARFLTDRQEGVKLYILSSYHNINSFIPSTQECYASHQKIVNCLRYMVD